jgi:hypothetical protein
MPDITINVTLVDGASADDVGWRLFEMLSSDPLDVFPEIDSVDGWSVRNA